MRKSISLIATALAAAPAASLAHPGHVADAGPLAAVHTHSLIEALLLAAMFAGLAVGVGLVIRRSREIIVDRALGRRLTAPRLRNAVLPRQG